MRTGFKDPIAVKDQTKVIKSPFNFDCPVYDERSSIYVNAGSHYGVGYTQPVGHNGKTKQNVDVLPRSKVNTMQVSEVPKRNKKLDLEL